VAAAKIVFHPGASEDYAAASSPQSLRDRRLFTEKRRSALESARDAGLAACSIRKDEQIDEGLSVMLWSKLSAICQKSDASKAENLIVED
jgi:hypothetical protein